MVMRIHEVVPPVLAGDPRSRGVALARLGAAHAGAVRERAASAMTHVATVHAEDWLARQWQAQCALLPEIAAFIEGLAEGHGLPPLSVFAGHIRYAIEDRAAEDAECSTFAIAQGGAVRLAKNRDNPAAMRPMQALVRQEDPAWRGGAVFSVGSLSSIPSASSGINAAGFCMTDTAVRTRDLGIGALRYYLMETLLARCTNVADGLALIRGLRHVGGGNLMLADRSGAVAAVEIGHSAVAVTELAAPGWLARTNHHLDAALAPRLKEPPGSVPRGNSESRLRRLHHALGVAGDWSIAACAAVLAQHEDATGEAALCRHGDETSTHSGVVYDPVAGALHLSRGNPCEPDWVRARF
jgi:isopenicillin-N N-acyltransferase-like protein